MSSPADEPAPEVFAMFRVVCVIPSSDSKDTVAAVDDAAAAVEGSLREVTQGGEL